MNESRENNAQLLHNILPGHVVSHFLSTQRSPDVSEAWGVSVKCLQGVSVPW